MSTKAGMRPDAASTMMRPVGVGRTSRGPIGVDGLTMTAGRPIALDHRLDQPLSRDLAALVGADPLAFRERTSSVAEPPSVSFKVATLLV